MEFLISASKFRILHVTPALFGFGDIFGGAERYSFELARHMANKVPTTLLSFGRRSEMLITPDGLKLHVLGPATHVRGERFNPWHIGLLRAVAEASVIHAHQTNILASECAALLGMLFGRKVFTSDLGGGGWCLNSRFDTSGWFHGHLHISEYSRILAGKVDDSKHRVIWGGVDTQKFRPNPSLAKESLVVYAGRLMPHKGIDNLIEALPEGLILEVIGRPYHNGYFEKLKHLAIGRKVVFRTQCDDAEMIRAYQRAMCVVLPSVYRDCYGNETRVPELLGQTPLEAMACGTPAIVTSVASLPEVVADGETGFIVPPNDPAALRCKLEWIRDHSAEAVGMGIAGRKRVEERFTWHAVVDRCLRAYRGVN